MGDGGTPRSGFSVATPGPGRGYLHGPGPPDRCPGCGRRYPWHPWACPVLVRLAAAYLATGGPGWRAEARRLEALDPAPFGPMARFWRDVAAEPEPEPGPAVAVLPCDGGLAEAGVDPPGVNPPGAAGVLTPALLAHPLLAGAEVLPGPFDGLHSPPSSAPE